MPYDEEKFRASAAALVTEQLSHVVDIHYRNIGENVLGTNDDVGSVTF